MVKGTKAKKQPKSNVQVNGSKVPREKENAESYLSKYPVWRFNKCDDEHPKWSIHKESISYKHLMDKLRSFEGMTWGDIQKTAGGRARGTNHHPIEISKLCKEAQERLNTLKFYYDEIYSLRLSGTERLFGILEEGVFHILWHDPIHEICPSPKKHT